MTPDERKQAMRHLTDELWNKGNLDICDEMYAANCSFHQPSFEIDGVPGLKALVSDLRRAQPDLHMDVQDVLCDGDMCCARWTSGGTPTGEFRGMPATGRSYVMTGMTMAKFDGDRIAEEWTNYDMLGALQQAGVIPESAMQPHTT
ncbi:MAG TPA: ester cyclase [Actinocatenispora sp.]